MLDDFDVDTNVENVDDWISEQHIVEAMAIEVNSL